MSDNPVAALEARMAILEARLRRQRRLAAALGVGLVIAATTWTPYAQPRRTIDERVTDLEKRFGGGGIGEPMKVRAPFHVVGRTGATIMEVDDREGTPLLQVSKDGVGVALGVGGSGHGFVLVRTAAKQNGAILGQFGQDNLFGLHVLGPDGKEIQGQLVRDKQGNGRLHIGPEGKGGVLVGVGDSGSGGVGVFEANGRPTASIGKVGGVMGFRLFHDFPSKPAASLHFGEKGGGQLRIFDARSTAVAVVGINEAGGRVQLASSATGSANVNLLSNAEGGRLVLFPTGSGTSARALLSANTADGSLVLFDKAGKAEATLSAGDTAGQLELSANEARMVQAGNLNGIGVVRTGPGGRAGGGFGVPGSYIRGTKAR